MRLLRCLGLSVGIINLYEGFGSYLHVFLARVPTINIEKLKRISQSSTHTWIRLSQYPAAAREVD